MSPQVTTFESDAKRLATRTMGALYGAAAGDALGWPQEIGANAVKSSLSRAERGRFAHWIRRTGGRFYSHEEEVLRGEYSDDTQLLIATARSLLCGGQEWFDWLTLCELPLWTLYERGGGRSTKAAALRWATGAPPWEGRSAPGYFNSGGNGVAMRIAPHVIVSARNNDFRGLSQDVVSNGVATHGHPRALVGASVFAYALWHLLNRNGTLKYGSLIEELCDQVKVWGAFPEAEGAVSAWLDKAPHVLGYELWTAWEEAVQEMRDLLERVLRGMETGSLSVEDDVLRDLGIFDARFGGAGTRTAAAAIFIASRYAADPTAGLLLSAYLEGADTDTLASMTSTLLGAISGADWLSSWIGELQDRDYLASLSQSLVHHSLQGTGVSHREVVNRAVLDRIASNIESSGLGEDVSLPNGLRGTLIDRISPPARSKQVSVTVVKIKMKEGPTIFVKRIRRSASATKTQPLEDDRKKGPGPTARVSRVGMKLVARNPERTREFYEVALGLEVTKESRASVTFAKVLNLVPLPQRALWPETQSEIRHSKAFLIWLETDSLENTLRRVEAFGAPIIAGPETGHARLSFRCLDPEGNFVEVFQVREPASG